MRIRSVALVLALLMGSAIMSAKAGEEEKLWGTYKLVSTTFHLLDTNENVVWDKDDGYITYTREGRMFVIIIRDPRPRPASIEKTTDAEKIKLENTVNAYSGPYTFDGHDIVHNVDLASNGVWNGTRQVRHAKLEGDRVILTTDPSERPTDGRPVTTTLIWQRVRN